MYPRSFADSDGDGVGDLPGITGRLGALAELGVDAVWLSPFYKSPQADAGYDVADYRDVDPIFGSLADFDALLERAHELGLKVIVDLVPNHSSDEHVWFKAALAAAPGSPERARYIFRDGRGENGELPPNNWVSCFRGPAWTRTTNPDGTPGQWYLHLFDTKQPDWDWENPEVRDEFLSVLKFWLDRGADGFRVDVAHSLIKAPGLPDLDLRVDDGPDADPEGFFQTGPMWDQDRVHEIYQTWRALLDTLRPRPDPGRRGLGAAAVPAGPLRPRGRDAPGVQLRLPGDRLGRRGAAQAPSTPRWRRTSSVGAPTTWVLSNHDVVRHVSRLGLSPARPAAERHPGRRRPAGLRARAAPGQGVDAADARPARARRTCTRARNSACPTTPRSTTTCARTRPGGGPEYTEAGRDGCRVPLPWEADAPGLGFGPTGEDLAAAAGLVRRTGPRPAGRGRGLDPGDVPVGAGPAPGVQARRRLAGVGCRPRRRRRGLHQRRGHGDREHGRRRRFRCRPARC